MVTLFELVYAMGTRELRNGNIGDAQQKEAAETAAPLTSFYRFNLRFFRSGAAVPVASFRYEPHKRRAYRGCASANRLNASNATSQKRLTSSSFAISSRIASRPIGASS